MFCDAKFWGSELRRGWRGERFFCRAVRFRAACTATQRCVRGAPRPARHPRAGAPTNRHRRNGAARRDSGGREARRDACAEFDGDDLRAGARRQARGRHGLLRHAAGGEVEAARGRAAESEPRSDCGAASGSGAGDDVDQSARDGGRACATGQSRFIPRIRTRCAGCWSRSRELRN